VAFSATDLKPLSAVAFTRDCTRLVGGCLGKFEPASEPLHISTTVPPAPNPIPNPHTKPHAPNIKTLTLNPAGKNIHVWDLRTMKPQFVPVRSVETP